MSEQELNKPKTENAEIINNTLTSLVTQVSITNKLMEIAVKELKAIREAIKGSPSPHS